MTRRTTLLPVLAAALTLALGLALGLAGPAAAAKAKSLLLGKPNKASKTTTLTNSGAGPALSLKTKAGQPPLAVSSSTKVAHLNADLLDGMDAADLQDAFAEPTTTVYTVPSDRYDGELHLEAGTYLLAMEVTMTDPSYTTSSDWHCYLWQDASHGFDPKKVVLAAGEPADANHTISVHDQRVVTLTGAHYLGFFCDGSVVQEQSGPMRLYVRELPTTAAELPPFSE